MIMKNIASLIATALIGLNSYALANDIVKDKGQTIDNNVYLNYTQPQLDEMYDQTIWAKNYKQIIDRYQFRSNLAEDIIGKPTIIKYGDSEIESFNIFKANIPNAPLVIFIHGGAWKSGRSFNYNYPAMQFHEKGINYISLDFSNVQEVGLDGMTKQIRKAVSYIYKNNKTLGFNKDQLFIVGHSSGAHLASVLLTTDWKAYEMPTNTIKGATLISGIYDLKPVRKSARSKYVFIDNKIENDYSPIIHSKTIKMPVIISYGGLESEEFKRQSIDFYEKLRNTNNNISLIKQDYFNHFEIMDDFGNPYNSASLKTIDMILNTKRVK